jgi:hypothetical protein
MARRSKRWFRIVQCEAGADDEEEDATDDRDGARVLAVDCSKTDALRLTLVARTGDDDADDSTHTQSEAVWRLAPCGRLVCRRFEAHRLVMDAAPQRRYLEALDPTGAWHPAMSPQCSAEEDPYASSQVGELTNMPPVASSWTPSGAASNAR